ncbi:CAP domain-containing protein [Streptomyces sp. NBC_00820]|uniref:CAP domain-containing protein n=1 Tax=Streptomyces sp. NBC_00820 TaxID=2975842 RepID=UPI002ED391ED|nr:CAP domain-containing protein [Streptomyces sp. NBC_00820]
MTHPTRVHQRATAIVAAALMTGGMALATGATATVASSAGLPADVSSSDQQSIVSETNSVRQGAGQSALSWDDSLAKASQAWADDPASTAGGLQHDESVNNAAENISSSGPTQATGQWASEKSAYDADPDHDSNSVGYKTKWGHYYNMIQPGYTKIGCGASAGITVCRYS